MSAAQSPVLSHPLNLIMLASAGVSAAWVGDWRPLAVGAAAELVWVAVSRVLGRRRRARARTEVDPSEQSQLRMLSEPLRRRFLELDRVRTDLRRLMAANPSLVGVGLERETEKVDALLSGWLRLASQVAHMRAIVEETDLEALAAEASAASDEAAASLHARLEAAQAARARVEESEASLVRVEEALRGLRDRVVSMSSPADLGASLDELLGGVDAAERAAREVEALERDATARARRSGARVSAS